MERVFRIFISSVGTLLEEERIAATTCILRSRYLPISMERFVGKTLPVKMVIEYLDMSDVVFLMAGHLYGHTINDLIKKECPIKDKCNKCESNCIISYTHFEYLYALHNNKGPYCFKLRGYDDDDTFLATLEEKKIKEQEINKMLSYYSEGKSQNKNFVDEIKIWREEYSGVTELSQALMAALQHIPTDNDFKNTGLIEANRAGIADALTIERQEPKRGTRFEEFNDDVKHSLDVYGMGMTKLSKKDKWLDGKVFRGIKVSLCMIDPKLFSDGLCNDTSSEINGVCDLLVNYNFQVTKKHFGLYSNNNDYYQEISESYTKLTKLIEKIRNKNEVKGEITLKTIKSFLPISINIKDKDYENAAMLVEFWLPFTEKRTIMEVKRGVDPKLFDALVGFYNEILKQEHCTTTITSIKRNGE